ncbi:MAG: hypothetical protein IIA33_07920, partial [Planctomycetes bacterium]|nr:hypothetical protein [Planctomycetota bacterium]
MDTGIASPEEIAAGYAKADAALIQSAEDFIKFGDQMLEDGKERRSDREQRALQLIVLAGRISRFTREERFQKALDAQNECNEVMKQDQLGMLTAAVAAAQQAKQLAFTFTGRQRASELLSAAFAELGEFWANFGSDFGIEADAELARKILEDKERRDELRDQLNKEAVARTRLSGPALSPALGLKAQQQVATQDLKLVDEDAERDMALVQNVIVAARTLRSTYHVPPAQRVAIEVRVPDQGKRAGL